MTMSILKRLKQDGSNTFADAYSSLVLGDDAGKSARIAFSIQPNLPLNLGMTFLEINGRAYVRTVDPESAAGQAGVQPRDAVQFAAVYNQRASDAVFNNNSNANANNTVDEDEEWSQSPSAATNGPASAKEYALDCEAKGMRVSYDDLKTMLREGLDPYQQAFLSPDSSTWKPAIPAVISVCVPMDGVGDYESSPFSTETPLPVVFVVRRTRQRPNVLWNFRLDDECDFASSLIRRLAPTADMDMPLPDTWEELVHDGTDWLLGNGSILPPKQGTTTTTTTTHKSAVPNKNDTNTSSATNTSMTTDATANTSTSIPFDDDEQVRASKLAHLRSRMAAEGLQADRAEDIEAATIRGMIQKAVGLAFVRASKVVLGVSVHAGSGVVIARLADGTWSAPSAVGTWGLGLGVQFGLEVAEYIFILQTQESLNHFRRGNSFTIGGNIGAAIAGMGREAYGAASVGNACATDTTLPNNKEDEYDDDESDSIHQAGFGVAPIVAYAKSQGLYIGVSLEGSRIFTRDDINARAYKFATGREVTANDILSGKVATPAEAEDLYASLHSVEFTHEMSCLPRPPEVLRKDSTNAWYYDRSTLATGQNDDGNPFRFLADLSKEGLEECLTFETQFKKFMYGGVSVQRLLPGTESRSGKTGRERRTLWVMLPEVGALRLGFVSKLSDGDGAVSNKSSTQKAKREATDVSVGDLGTVASEEVTLDSTLVEKESNLGGHIRTGNVQLSHKHSVALTDVTLLSQEPHVPVRFNPEDQTEHLRVISVQDVSGTSLLFLANNFREAELLVCGLKLLMEQETARLGVRGGLPITALGGKAGDGAMSPTAARGFKESSIPTVGNRRRNRSGRSVSGYSSSEMDEDMGGLPHDSLMLKSRHLVPEGRGSWGNVPGRDYMRGQAAQLIPHDLSPRMYNGQHGIPKYVHGQLLVRDIATNIQLPLPLPLCRVLLLDSSSPVITKWEKDRGDSGFTKTHWTFPPATPRELERHDSEHQLIASGSMMGAHRTTTFDRPRNGAMVRLSETQIIDADDSEKLAFTVSERNPRRGFSIKVRILLRSHKENCCEATILGEVRPVGKNMSNQAAVHKAFLVVLNEIKERYGVEGNGLLAGFLTVVNSLPSSDIRNGGRTSSSPVATPRNANSKDVSFSPFPNTQPRGGITPSRSSPRSSSEPNSPPAQSSSGLVSLDDMIRQERMARPSTPAVTRTPPEKLQPPSSRLLHTNNTNKDYNVVTTPADFADFPADEARTTTTPTSSSSNTVPKPKTIEVKPLPKIRLSLMPSPREEDEEESSHDARPIVTKRKKKRSSRHRTTPPIGPSSTKSSSTATSRSSSMAGRYT